MSNNIDDLVIPKGFLFDPERSILTSNLFVHNGKYYTPEVVEGLFTYYDKLNPADESNIYRWYVQSLANLNSPVKVQDPFATAKVITDAEVYSLQIADNFPKVGVDFIRLVKLYQTYCVGGLAKTNGALEVGVVLFYHPETHQLRFVLPTQKVLSTHWGWSMKHKEKAFFLDGTETSLDQLEAAGWIKCGTSHSHNTMNITWSDLDRKDQVGTVDSPKMTAIHVLLYGFKNHSDLSKEPDFNIQVSASVNGKWQELDPSAIFDGNCTESFESIDFDEKILSIVTTTTTYVYPARQVGGIYNQYYTAGQYWQKHGYQYQLPASSPQPKIGAGQANGAAYKHQTRQDEVLEEAALIRNGQYTEFYSNQAIIELISDIYNILISRGLDFAEALIEIGKYNSSFQEGLFYIESLDDVEEEVEAQLITPDNSFDVVDNVDAGQAANFWEYY